MHQDEAVVVTDSEGHVVTMTRAARQLFGTPFSAVKQEALWTLFPASGATLLAALRMGAAKATGATSEAAAAGPVHSRSHSSQHHASSPAAGGHAQSKSKSNFKLPLSAAQSSKAHQLPAAAAPQPPTEAQQAADSDLFVPRVVEGPGGSLLCTTVSLVQHKGGPIHYSVRVVPYAADASVVVSDSTGQIQWVSPEAGELFGWKPDELRGQNVSVLMTEPHASLHTGYMTSFVERGCPVSGSVVVGRTRHVSAKHRDGHVLALRVTVELRRGGSGGSGSGRGEGGEASGPIFVATFGDDLDVEASVTMEENADGEPVIAAVSSTFELLFGRPTATLEGKPASVVLADFHPRMLAWVQRGDDPSGPQFASARVVALHGDGSHFAALLRCTRAPAARSSSAARGRRQRYSYQVSVRQAPPADLGEFSELPIVVGEYEIVRRLADGGFSRIYEARHLGLGVHRAVKVFSKAQLVSEGQPHMVEEEVAVMRALAVAYGRAAAKAEDEHMYSAAASAAAATTTTAGADAHPDEQDDAARAKRPGAARAGRVLPAVVRVRSTRDAFPPTHPKLVRLWDEMETSQNYFLVLELMGHTLALESAMTDGIPEARARAIFRQIAEALRFMHASGVTHRDIKPHNVLFVPGQRDSVKLCDFGCSHRVEPGSADLDPWLDQAVGSALFAAPEVAVGGRYRGHAADAWSLGVLLYVMLTDDTWWVPSEVVAKNALRRFLSPAGEEFGPEAADEDDDDIRVSSRAGMVSSKCADLICWLLSENPAERPTMDEVLQHEWTTEH